MNRDRMDVVFFTMLMILGLVIFVLVVWNTSHPSWEQNKMCIRSGYDNAKAVMFEDGFYCQKTVKWEDVQGGER